MSQMSLVQNTGSVSLDVDRNQSFALVENNSGVPAAGGFISGHFTDLPNYLGMDGLCCRIHQGIKCGEVGMPGCAGWSHGTHPSVAVLYAADRFNTVCHAETGQLVLDRKFAALALSSSRLGAYMNSAELLVVRKFGKGKEVSVSVYGAGYCYLHSIRGNFRSRVARVVGPLPYVADVMRMVNLVGICVGPALKFEKIMDGIYHVSYDRSVGVTHMAGLSFFHEGMRLLREHGSDLRIGMNIELSSDVDVLLSGVEDEKKLVGGNSYDYDVKFAHVRKDNRGLQAVYGDVVSAEPQPRLFDDNVKSGGLGPILALFRESKVFLPVQALEDLALCMHTAATIHSGFSNGGSRLRALALLGDRILKVLLVLKGMSRGASVGDIQAMESKSQSNGALLRAAQDCGFVAHLKFAANVPRDSVKIVGTAVEAIVGVVGKWCSIDDALVIAKLFKLIN